MATLHHLLALSPIASRKPFFAFPIPLSGHQNCRCSRIAVTSSSKPRKSRKATSDAEICNEIREFLSSVGLPENHLPSVKELSQNGRQGLANLVRRRGYKLIRQLLEAAPVAHFNASLSDTGPVSSEDQDNLEVLADDAHEGPKLDDLTLESKSSSVKEVAKFDDPWESDEVEDSDSETEHTDETKLKSLSEDANEEGRLYNWDLDSETHNMKIEAERKHLESLMQETESEMKRLNEVIADEEVSLSILKKKTEKEIKNMTGIHSEASGFYAVDANLHALKMVEVEYSGHGAKKVEVAGSFNGWTRPIEMVRVPQTRFGEHLGLPQTWAVSLWLYPGVYQIKFLVDGRWTLDGSKETIFQGFTHNNILRVQ